MKGLPMIRDSIRYAVFLLAAAGSTAVTAAPAVTSSVPAANAVVTKPSRIEILLSEKVAKRDVAIDLVMTAMPGMADHGPMRISRFKIDVSKDGKTIAAILPRPLPAGSYTVQWKAGNAQGKFSFSVK